MNVDKSAVATGLGVVAGSLLLGDRASSAGIICLAVCLPLLQAAGQRWPVGALAASATLVFGLAAAGLTAGAWVWPASLAYGRAAQRGHLAWAVGLGTLYLVAGSAVAGRALGGEALWLGLVLAASAAYRSERRLKEETQARLRAA
ncbi:hypothetical protein ACWEPL_60965 [Nonomuraea sp. NPDC004186]